MKEARRWEVESEMVEVALECFSMSADFFFFFTVEADVAIGQLRY